MRKINYSIILLFGLLCCFSCNRVSEIDGITEENLNEKIKESYDSLVIHYRTKPFESLQLFMSVNQIDIKDPKSKALYLYQVASQSVLEGDNTKATKCFEEALKLFDQLGLNNEAAICYNDMSFIELDVGTVSRAYELMDLAVANYDPETHATGLVETYYNYNNTLLVEEKWEASIEYADKAIALIKSRSLKSRERFFKVLYRRKGRAYMKLGEYDLALQNIEMALSYCDPTDDFVYLGILHGIYGELYSLKGEKDKAIKEFNLALDFKEKDVVARRKSFEQQSDKNAELVEEVQVQRGEIIQQQSILILLAVCLVVIAAVLSFIIFSQLRKLKTKSFELSALNKDLVTVLKEKEKVNAKLEKKTNQVNSLLEINNRTLFSQQLKISSFNDSIESAIKSISKLNDLQQNVSSDELFKLKRHLESISSKEDIWKDFKIQFEQIRPDFFKKLNEKYPELSVHELKHCAYVVSNLKNKEVARLINVSIRSVETARYRIKKKLKLEAQDSLYDLLQHI